LDFTGILLGFSWDNFGIILMIFTDDWDFIGFLSLKNGDEK
jgi:hypothetical protein